MGLKDHYCVYSDDCYANFKNSDYQAPGAHAWDVMATGMYNNGGITPPNYSAFERNFMGWLKYDSLTVSDGVVAIPPLGKSNFAFRISFSKDEWYILENRQLNKWDSKLPNHGMLIWHIDYNDQAWQNDAMNFWPCAQRPLCRSCQAEWQDQREERDFEVIRKKTYQKRSVPFRGRFLFL